MSRAIGNFRSLEVSEDCGAVDTVLLRMLLYARSSLVVVDVLIDLGQSMLRVRLRSRVHNAIDDFREDRYVVLRHRLRRRGGFTSIRARILERGHELPPRLAAIELPDRCTEPPARIRLKP